MQSSLSWFVNTFQSLANWKASVDRLLTFHRALEQAKAGQARHDGLDVQRDGERTVRAEQLDLVLPNGRTILANGAFTIEPGERIVLTGPSGVGKEHALPGTRRHLAVRARARPLPRQRARAVPAAEALHSDRQLRDAVAYPGAAAEFGDEAIRATLADVDLPRLAEHLEEVQNWSLQLSGGEQQTPRDRARAAAQARLAVPGRGDRPRSTRRARSGCTILSRTAAGRDAREHRAPAGRGARITGKRFRLVPDGERMRLAIASG